MEEENENIKETMQELKNNGKTKPVESEAKINDQEFISWLRDIKSKDVNWFLSHGNNKKLREEFKKFLEEKANDDGSSKTLYNTKIRKLNSKTIEQIKKFNIKELTLEQELLVDESIIDLDLKERYKKYGLCEECGQPKIFHNWCQPCNAKHFEQDFDKWTSGNQKIDKFIQECQLGAVDKYGILEWIPYEQFTNVEKIGEGGFGKVYGAIWVDGYIRGWNSKNSNWDRRSDWIVALKVLNNSQDITVNFLREVAYHKKALGSDFWTSQVTRCQGISQDLKTKDYIMVMDYMSNGNLKQYISNNCKDLDFKDKLLQLFYIAKGLNDVHKRGLIHHDFHPGNILNGLNNDNYARCYITDLGLCRPTNEKDEEKKEKIYGVLPYLAPEVLWKKSHTQAADIYSFGVVIYEMISALPPYVVYDKKEKIYKEVPHNAGLALAICKGLRPNLNDNKAPQLLKDLISKCWNAEPSLRPKAIEVYRDFLDWRFDILDKKDTKFYQQYQETEKINRKLPFSITNPVYKTHPQSVYASRLLEFTNLPKPRNSKEINEKFYSSEKYLQLLQDSELLDLDFPEEQTKTSLQSQEKSIEKTKEIKIEINPNPNNTESSNFLTELKNTIIGCITQKKCLPCYLYERWKNKKEAERLANLVKKGKERMENELVARQEIPPKK